VVAGSVKKELTLRINETSISVDLKGGCKHAALDSDLSGVLHENLLADWLGLGLRGQVNLDDLQLHLDIKDKQVRNLHGELKVRVNGADMDAPIKIQNVHGNLDLKVDSDDGKNFRLKGDAEGLSFELDQRLFSDVEADFSLNGQQFRIEYFQSSYYEGKIRGQGQSPLVVNLDPPRSFKGNFLVELAPLRSFFNRGDYSLRNLTGRVDGSVIFKGEMDNPHRTTASGEIIVREGVLFELPIFGNLSRMMGNIFSTDPPTFTGGSTDFNLKQGIIHLSDISINSTLMHLSGEGRLTPDGVDLKLIPSTSIMPTIPILGHIVDILKNGLLSFKISGPYSNINVSYDTIVNRIFTDNFIPDEQRTMGRIEYQFSERF